MLELDIQKEFDEAQAAKEKIECGVGDLLTILDQHQTVIEELRAEVARLAAPRDGEWIGKAARQVSHVVATGFWSHESICEAIKMHAHAVSPSPAPASQELQEEIADLKEDAISQQQLYDHLLGMMKEAAAKIREMFHEFHNCRPIGIHLQKLLALADSLDQPGEVVAEQRQ